MNSSRPNNSPQYLWACEENIRHFKYTKHIIKISPIINVLATNLLQYNPENDQSHKVYSHGMNSFDLYKTRHKAEFRVANTPTRTQLKQIVLQWTIYACKCKFICYSLKIIYSTEPFTFSKCAWRYDDRLNTDMLPAMAKPLALANKSRKNYIISPDTSFVYECIHSTFIYVLRGASRK